MQYTKQMFYDQSLRYDFVNIFYILGGIKATVGNIDSFATTFVFWNKGYFDCTKNRFMIDLR